MKGRKNKPLNVFFIFIFFVSTTISFSYLVRNYYTIDEIIKIVEKYSKHKFNTKPIIRFLGEKEFSKKINSILKRDYPNEKILKECLFLHAFKLMKKDVSLLNIKRNIYFKNVAGFYDEGGKSNEIFIKGKPKNKFSKMEAMLLFHELWHLIQKNRINFEKNIPDTIEYDDRKLAILSMLEGDAIRFMEEVTNIKLAIDNPDISIEEVLSLSGDNIIKTSPRIIREELIFPYLYGTRFVKYFEKRGKKAEIYKIPPTSSYEIIFPSSYPLKLKDKTLPHDKFLSGRVGIFFINIILNRDRTNLNYLRGWKSDFYYIAYNKKSKKYSLNWEINFEGLMIKKIEKLLKKRFPEAKVKIINNKKIKFFKEGYYGCNHCHTD